MKSLAIVLSITLASVMLLGAPVYSADDDPLFLGQANRDWVYTAVNPCRLADTRVATKWAMTPIAGGTARIFKVRGDVESQNGGLPAGNAETCPSPKGEPRAVHINITATGASQPGNLQVAPAAAGALVGSAWMSFVPGQNISNAGTVKNNFVANPANEDDIQIFASRTTDVVIDVLGYYYDTPVIIDSDFAAGNGLPPDFNIGNWVFAANPARVDVTRNGQRILVTSNQSFRCNFPGFACTDLDIAICTQVVNPDLTLGAFAIETPQVNDLFSPGLTIGGGISSLYGLSAILDKGPGTYDVGLCAKSADASWDAPTGGHTTAVVFSD